MMKILFVVGKSKYFYTHRLLLANFLLSAGYDIHIAVPFDADITLLEGFGFTLHPIYLNRGSINPLLEARTLLSLIRVCRQLKPDVIHNIALKSVLYGSIAAKICQIPANVNLIPGLGFLFISQKRLIKCIRAVVLRLYRLLLNNNRTRTIFQNADDQVFFQGLKIVSPDNSVVIRGSGVDTNQYPALPEPEAPITVVLASRLLWDKGVGEFVEAAKLLQNRCEARFVLVGDVDSANPASITTETLEQWVSEGLVEWWGWHEEMVPIFQQCHVVCLPSYREGLPKVLIEATSCQRAIVTTDVPGCREVVDDGKNGLLVPVKDAQQLARALETLINHTELRKTMGLASRLRAETEFSCDIVNEQTLAVYQQFEKQAS